MNHPYNIILISQAVFLIVQGAMYAYQMSKTPTQHGYTWTGVATGSLMIAGGATFAIYIILDWAGLIATLWPVLFVPGAVLALVGSSMAIGQMKKQGSANHLKNDIKETGEFDLL